MTADDQPTFRLRPEQQAIVHGYSGGKLGIAAVPGSGKTFTLAHLAARLVIQRVQLRRHPRQGRLAFGLVERSPVE